MNLYPVGALSAIHNVQANAAAAEIAATQPAAAIGDSTDRDADGRQQYDEFNKSEPPPESPLQPDVPEPPPNRVPDVGDGHIDLLA